MRNVLFGLLVSVVVVVTLLIAAEGIHSLVQGGKPHVSLSYDALEALGLAGPPKSEAGGAYAPYFTDPSELSDLIETLTAAGVGVGNSPFEELKNDQAAMNLASDGDGCLGLKPGVRRIAFFLRSPTYNPFNPITVLYDPEKTLDSRLTAFFDHYGTSPVAMSINADGQRVTLPLVERPRKVLVAGDSVAFGALVEDGETLASQLQGRDTERQYVNLGVSGATARDIVCRVEAAAGRYSGQIDELIYVYCENDFQKKEPYGKAEDVVAWLADLAEREHIGKVTVVFAPYIYTVAPEVTRFEGYYGGRYPHHDQQREDLVRAVEAVGFGWVDIGTLAREEQQRSASPLAFFALFIDHVHWSRLGTARVADRIMTE